MRDVLREDSDLGEPDLVVLRHVVEHLFDPVETLRTVRTALGEHSAALYVEVPAAEHLLREAAIWDVIYPHVTTLTATALRTIAERAGFHVRRHGYSFGGQYLWIEASTNDVFDDSGSNGQSHVTELVDGFARRASAKRELWTERLHRLEERGSVALWGAGAKGSTFLNIVDGGGEVGPVVDVNPRKHGRFLPGTGQRVVPPDVLESVQPDAVILTNPIYTQEIESALHGMHVDSEVLVA